MKTLITLTTKSIIAGILLMMSIGSFAKSTNKTTKADKVKDVKIHAPKKSLHYYLGVDGKKHYIRAVKSGTVKIYKEDMPQKEWYTMMAFTKKTETLGYFSRNDEKPFIVVELISAKH